MERFAKLVGEYDAVIERLKTEITKKYEEDIQDLDQQKVHMREMLQKTIISELPSSSTNNQQQQNSFQATRQQQSSRKVTLECRPMAALSSPNQARQDSSQNSINGEETMSNGSTSSPVQKKRKSFIASAQERPRIERTMSQASQNNGSSEQQQQQSHLTQRSNSLSQASQAPVKKVSPLKISTKNSNINNTNNCNNNANNSANNVNNNTNNLKSNDVNNANNNPPESAPRQESRLPPVKFKIIRDSNTSTTNYQHVTTQITEQTTNQSQSSSSQNQAQQLAIKDEEDKDYEEYEIVDEANATPKTSQDDHQDNPEGNGQQEDHEENLNDTECPFDGDELMNDESYIEESNMPLPEAEPYQDEEDFELPEFSNADHSREMGNIRVKTEFVEGEGSSDKTICVFCKKQFNNCGINRHSERCWKLHGGHSKKWIYCTFPECSYGTMKSKYSQIYSRNHVMRKHGITSEGEADEYIKCRVLL